MWGWFVIRFGEDDANLMLEDKMWARMQKERNQRSRNAGLFNLGEDTEIGEGDTLTHKGRALGNELEDHDRSDQDEDLNAEVVDQLHFGGDARDGRHAHQVSTYSCCSSGPIPRNACFG